MAPGSYTTTSASKHLGGRQRKKLRRQAGAQADEDPMAPLRAELAKNWLPFELLCPDDDDQTLRLIPIPPSSRVPEVAEVNQMGRLCSSLTGGVAC